MADSRRYFSEIMNTNTVETEEDDEEKARIYKDPMKRNLLDDFDKTMPVDVVSDERMSVFLRVRPFSGQEAEGDENQGCVVVQNNNMVKANAPKDSHTYKAQLYGLNKASHTFTFSKVFPESTTQKEFFDSTMLKLVQDFIEGQNCLVFTYGVTNSGKTYTIQGNPRNAGVLPRGLDVLFNSISGKQWPGMDLKPHMFCDVVKLSPEQEETERKSKERTLKLNSSEDHDVMTLLGDDASDQSVMNATGHSDSSTCADKKPGLRDSQESLIEEVENRVREETAIDVTVQGQIRFSVWVSFAEIYNEQIFDLLEPLPKKKNAKRPVLKLGDDRRGSPYIKGLKEINVTSADEAYKLLTIGQRNLKTACTRLNHCSSRSHCIFNIKVIRVPDKGNPRMARVSMLSLCDLAGSERHSKTHTTGDRLKEAGNINTSLLTLGRCIELLRYNQQHKEKEKIIPFRDSRLTRLFQNFFCGRGKAAMIVNVSQCASMFDETLNVFKFSAIAKQVVMPPKPVEKPAEPRQRKTKSSARASSICWDPSATPSRRAGVTRATAEPMVEEEEEGEEETEDEDAEYIQQLEERVELLEAKMKEMRRDRTLREVKIRKEVCTEMQEQFVKIEDMYSNMLRQTQKDEEEKFEQKLQLLVDYNEAVSSKRRRLDPPAASTSHTMVDDEDEWVSSILLHQEKVRVQERDHSLTELQQQTTQLEFKVADLTRKNKDLAQKAADAEQALKTMEQELSKNKDLAQKAADAEQALKTMEQELSKNKDLAQKAADAEQALKKMEEELSKNKDRAEEAQRKLEQECAEKVAQAESIREAAVKEAAKSSDDCVLLETLGQQLQEAKDRLKQQEKEMGELNEMLTDAGETFLQKEEEMAKLKQAISEDEEKSAQQVETIRELRALLEESKAAVEESEKRLEAKNRSIGDMKGELSRLESRIQDGRKAIDANDALKTCQEELVIACNRLKHEEEDFQQREKALIHGYTAEINNLKSQMALLKSKNLGKCAATSPMKAATPEKSRSPLRQRRKVHGGGAGRKRKGSEMEESMRLDLVQQIKDLQSVLNKSGSLTSEARQKLREAWETAEAVHLQLEERGELEARLEQSQRDLQELQGKFEELSSASTELQRQLDNKKELHTELTDNQSESAELRQKLRIAESSAEDLESRLTAAKQKELAAEASKSEVVTELRDTKVTLTQLEAKKKESDLELDDLRQTVSSVTDRSTLLQSECDTYKLTLDARTTNFEAAVEEKDQLEGKVKDLEEQVEKEKAEAETAREKVEALETVVTELRSMLSQTAGDLESKSKQLAELGKETKDEGRLAASNESLLKSALSEANECLQQRTQQCEYLQTQVSDSETRMAEVEARRGVEEQRVCELEAKLQAVEGEKDSAMARNEELQKQVAAADQQLEELRQELDTHKASHTSAEDALTEQKDNYAAVQQELEALKASHSSAEDVLAEKKDTYAAVQKELEALKASHSSAETTLTEQRDNYAAVQKELEAVKVSHKAAEDALTEQKDSFAAVQKELEELKMSHKSAQDALTEQKDSFAAVQKELEELKLSHKSTQDALTEQKKLRSAAEKELERTKRMLEELKESESSRLHKLQALEKAQKEARRVQEKKLTEAREALEAREREVGELQASLAQLREEAAQSDTQETQLSEATVELADLRSSLHMQTALTHKHKESAETLAAEKAELEQRVDSVTQELQKLEKEKANLLEEMSVLKTRLAQTEAASKESTDRLTSELSQQKTAVEKLTAELQQRQQTTKDFDSYDQKAGEERAEFEKRLNELEAEEKRWRESHHKVKAELDTAKAALAQLQDCKSKVDETVATSHVKNERGNSADNVKVEELESHLEIEKSKNGELQKQLKALCLIDTATDAPGSSRRLRKEKIQAESDLANARFEMEKLQGQVEKLLNVKETTTTSILSPSSFVCSICRSNRAKAEPSDSNSVDQLRHDLVDKSRLLQEEETVRQRCECELLEVKAKLENTAVELKESQARLHECEQRSRSESKQMAAVSVASHQRDAFTTLHAELEKQQEREAKLRKELQDCTKMVNSDRLAQLEEQLANKTSELEQANQREMERLDQSIVKGDSSVMEELQQQLATLRSQLDSKDQLLTRCQQQRNIAVADVKANEVVLQHLKDAMMEQEETMEKQDTVISAKDEEIASLTAAAEKELSEVKKACAKDTSLLLEKEKKLKHTIQSLEKEISELRVKLEREGTELRVKLEREGTELRVRLEKEMTELRDKLEREEAEKKALVKEGTDLRDRLEREVSDLRDRLEKKVAEKKALEKEATELRDKLEREGVEKKDGREAEKELSKVKKACAKDTALFLEKETKLKHTIHALEKELTELRDKLEREGAEKKEWREARDKLVEQMDGLMTQQLEENKALKLQLEEDQQHYGKLLDAERLEKQELKRELKVVTRAKDSALTDLRHGNHQLQVELALAQGTEPPPRPPPPQHQSFRVNDSELVDDIDTTGHLQVDATPPVAAKSVRRKRTSALNTSSGSSAGGSKSRRRQRKKLDESLDVVQEAPESPDKMSARLRDLEDKAVQSPVTRSAKKLLRLISPERTCRVFTEQEDTPATEDATSTGKRGKRKGNKEDAIPPPFDCAPYQPPGVETRKSSRLRTRTAKQ